MMTLSPLYVTFQTPDLLNLPGFLFPSENTKKIALFLHGNGTSSILYSFDKLKAYSEMLAKHNIGFFAFANRGSMLVKNFRISQENGMVSIKKEGTAYELIKESIIDINSALAFLTSQGYEEFYLIGESSGANKICIYDHYERQNSITKYILISGGDDTGIYYESLGRDQFFRLLAKAKAMISQEKGEELIPYNELNGEILSYQSYYDTCNADGDYNCFPFREYIQYLKLSQSLPLFSYYTHLSKPYLSIYGGLDAFAWSNIDQLREILEKFTGDRGKFIIDPHADHGFFKMYDALMSHIEKVL